MQIATNMENIVKDDGCNSKRSRETRGFSLRCSPYTVYKVIRALTDHLKEVVKDMGFETFIGMQNCNLHRDLI